MLRLRSSGRSAGWFVLRDLRRKEKVRKLQGRLKNVHNTRSSLISERVISTDLPVLFTTPDVCRVAEKFVWGKGHRVEGGGSEEGKG